MQVLIVSGVLLMIPHNYQLGGVPRFIAMTDDPLADALLITPFHRAVYQVLLEAGFTEGRDTDEGKIEGPPVSMASMLTMTLEAFPTEDQLLDAMTWGRGTPQQLEELRPIARKLLALRDSDAAPA